MPTSFFEQVGLQSKLVYSLIVAGKSAEFANQALRRLFEGLAPWPVFAPPEAVRGPCSPFEALHTWSQQGRLAAKLREARTGNYTKLERAFTDVARRWRAGALDLKTCTPRELETIHGVGPKTSRFFILWTRPDARYAALDVHVLRWLCAQGYQAPRSTPNGAKYQELERCFLLEADKRGLTPRELDYQIWRAGSTAANRIT